MAAGIDFEEALVAFLKADGTLKSLLGTRIYPQHRPQSATPPKPPDTTQPTFPALTYFRVSTERTPSQDGVLGLTLARIQLAAWSSGTNGFRDAKQIMRRVRLCRDPLSGLKLDGFRGRMGDFTVDGAWLDQDRDSYTPPAHADDLGIHQVSADLRVWFQETDF